MRISIRVCLCIALLLLTAGCLSLKNANLASQISYYQGDGKIATAQAMSLGYLANGFDLALPEFPWVGNTGHPLRYSLKKLPWIRPTDRNYHAHLHVKSDHVSQAEITAALQGANIHTELISQGRVIQSWDHLFDHKTDGDVSYLWLGDFTLAEKSLCDDYGDGSDNSSAASGR